MDGTHVAAGLGIVVHTGWAACVLAEGTGRSPPVTAREHVELLGDPERFVFHRASEMPPAKAKAWVDRQHMQIVARAARVLERLARGKDPTCAVVAKLGAMLPLEEILASHPRIHTAEGRFYRDALLAAAQGCGLTARAIAPETLNPKEPRLADVGRALGKPWTTDYKLATLAAWSAARWGDHRVTADSSERLPR
jgi:hypothetical protein